MESRSKCSYNAINLWISCDNHWNYNAADIIIQDCEVTPYKSGVHAHWSELITLDRSIKNKMFLIHYQDSILAPDEPGSDIADDWIAKAEEEGFAGFLFKGQDLTVKEMLQISMRP